MKRPLKVFVSSSWKNTAQPEVVQALRGEGYDVYDFRENKGFNWEEIDPDWEQWDATGTSKGLAHPLAVDAFESDMVALEACDVCVMVQPCGRSSHAELGYAVGIGKMTVVLISDDSEPELMVKMADYRVSSIQELLFWIRLDQGPNGREVPEDHS